MKFNTLINSALTLLVAFTIAMTLAGINQFETAMHTEYASIK